MRNLQPVNTYFNLLPRINFSLLSNSSNYCIIDSRSDSNFFTDEFNNSMKSRGTKRIYSTNIIQDLILEYEGFTGRKLKLNEESYSNINLSGWFVIVNNCNFSYCVSEWYYDDTAGRIFSRTLDGNSRNNYIVGNYSIGNGIINLIKACHFDNEYQYFIGCNYLNINGLFFFDAWYKN